MKQFKVKEKFLVEGWTYVRAESLEEAQRKLENGEEDSFTEVDSKHESTDWNTLKEAGE